MDKHRKQWGVAISEVIRLRDIYKREARHTTGDIGRVAGGETKRMSKLLHRFENGDRSDRLYNLLTEAS